MIKEDADMKADMSAASGNPEDRGESIGLMEPLLIGESSPQRAAVTDLAVELAPNPPASAAACREGVLAALADLVRAMNCYYSNLIEGHDTHPVDIERALKERLQRRPPQARPAARSQGAYRGPALDR